MKTRVKKIGLICSVIVLFGCNKINKNIEENTIETPLNVILMIGDGMGLSQITTAFYFGESTPNFKRFKEIQ